MAKMVTRKCSVCGNETSTSSTSKNAYCSRSCRIHFNIDVNHFTQCWEWTGTVGREGYGQISWKGQVNTAPRHSYMEWNGSIPPKVVVRHICDNKLCCNPKHLELGTYKENAKDRFRQDNFKAGPVTRSKEEILEIVELLKTKSVKQVSEEKKMSPRVVYNINAGHSYSEWTNIPPKARRKGKGRSSTMLTHQGRTQSLRDWANELNLKIDLIYKRRADGLSVEEVLAPKNSNYRFINRTPRSQKPKS